MQIRIVPAQEGDLDTLCAIMDAAAAALDNPDLFVADDRAFIARHLGREGFTLLALAEGRAAGFLIVRLPGMAEDNLGRDLGLPPEMLGRVAHMESTAVLSPFRGHGIQKQLMARAEALLRDFEGLFCEGGDYILRAKVESGPTALGADARGRCEYSLEVRVWGCG